MLYLENAAYFGCAIANTGLKVKCLASSRLSFECDETDDWIAKSRKIADDLSQIVRRRATVSRISPLILLFFVVLSQTFLEVLRAEGVQRRLVARPAGCREMRAASQAFAATGGP